MANLKPSSYVPTAKVVDPADNPFIATLEPFVAKGVGTPIDAEFSAEDYKREKLQMQTAANYLGVTVREVVTDWDAENPPKVVHSTFLVRPMRKRKGAGSTGEDSTAESE